MASHRDSNVLRHLGLLFEAGTTTGLTDGQLLERFRLRGDASAELAFEALVERHGPMVLRTCRAVLRDGHEAQDAFQATFLILARKGETLWVRDSIGPWLHRVARRASTRLRRDAEKRRLAERNSARTADHRHDSTRFDLLTAIHDEVDRLPDRFRVPILLCDLEGRGYEEAARDLGCPVGTIKSRLARGRERVRNGLTRRGLAPVAASLGLLVADEAIAAISPSLARSTLDLVMGLESSEVITLLIKKVSLSMTFSRFKILMFRSVLGTSMVLGGAVAGSMARPGDPVRGQGPSKVAALVDKPQDAATKGLFTSPSWRRTDVYEPPDFNRFFPDDLDGAKRLAALWNAPDKQTRPTEEILQTTRRGMRRADGRLRAEVIRWIGGKFIWGRQPQDPDAIEIMYHALNCPNLPNTFNTARHYAIWFGLSNLQPDKPPAVLHALVDLCMLDDDHTVFGHELSSRVAWGASFQRDELLAYLKPYLASKDEAVRDHAVWIEKVFKEEVRAYESWLARLAQYTKANYGARLPEWNESLAKGDSRGREETLRFMNLANIGLILDDTFLPALESCALDQEPRVRQGLATVLGRMDGAKSPGIIEILLRLAKDENSEVRHDAMYWGLAGSFGENRPDVLHAVVAFTLSSGSSDLKKQIDQALSHDPEATARILEEVIRGDDFARALAARSLYREITSKEPPGTLDDDPATRGVHAKAFWDLYGFLGRTYPNFAMKRIDWNQVGQEFLPRVAGLKTEEEFGLLVEELVARLEDSHALVLAGSAKPPVPDRPRWDPGLACLIDNRGRTVVYAVEPGSPADRSGIKPGMTLITVNDVKADDLLTQWMRELRRYHGFSSDRLLRQEAALGFCSDEHQGAKLSIVLEDPQGQKKTVEVEADRGRRNLPRLPVPRVGIKEDTDVFWTTLDASTGYIRVRRIAAGLEPSIDSALNDLGAIQGLIIDVRGNSGGGFDASTAFANFDLSLEAVAGSRPRYSGPIALLIDERCISAGEGWSSWFVARKRARLFGATTAGASSRKISYTTTDGRYKIIVPVKAYTGSLDRPIEFRGLEPDVEVRPDAKDLAQGRDTALEKAADWLRGETPKR